jgi:hypothetical protein
MVQLHASAALSPRLSLLYRLDRMFNGPLNREGSYEEENIFFPLPGLETQFIGRLHRSLDALQSKLRWQD